MPSWQAKLLDPLLRLQVKRKLGKARTAAAARAAFGAPLPPPRGASFTPDNLGGVSGEWVEAGGTPAGTILYLHGGGYLACSPKTHRPVTAAFALRGLKLFVPDYRLAPENPFPAAVDDALAVYKALLASGLSPLKLAIAGDSAGGGLTLALLLAAKGAGLPMPAAAILFSPWTDLAFTGASITGNVKRDAMLHGDTLQQGADFYLNGADPKNPLISPLYGDLAGLPPLFIQVGEPEMLRDDSTRLAIAAKAAGVPVTIKIWDGLPHVWQMFQFFLPEARQALDDAATYAKSTFRP